MKIKGLLCLIFVNIIITLLLISCVAQPDANKSLYSNGQNGTQVIKTGQNLKKVKNILKFGATYMTMDNPYFSILDEEIRSVVEEKGDELVTLDPQYSVSRQISCIEDFVSQGVDLIFLNPVDWKEILPAVEKAKKAGIQIVVVDAPVADGKLVDCTIVSDNYNAGVLAAEHMMSKLKKANIAILDHPAAKSALDRVSGFKETIADHPDFKIIAQSSPNGQLEQSMQMMKDIMKTNPKIDVVFAINDPSAIGAAAAIESDGKRKNILVYGVDGSPEAKSLIRLGKMTATSFQSPGEIGITAAETAYKLINGEKVENNIKIPVKLVDKSNVDNFPGGW